MIGIIGGYGNIGIEAADIIKTNSSEMIRVAGRNISKVSQRAKSGKRRALLSFPPLRTVRDSFPSYGSSLIKPIAATISRLYIIRIQI